MGRMRVLMTLLCALISTSVVLPGVQAPQQAGAQASAKLYLPFVAGRIIVPQLQAPAEGATLTTLAPLISFTPTMTGTHRIEIATTDTFATTTIVFSTTLNLRDTTLPSVTRPANSNLDDSTRFYWRVGLIQAGNTFFSGVRTFVTPDKSATALPPKPALEAPSEGAVVPSGVVTLSWKPVTDALYYRVTANRADGSELDSELLDGRATSFALTSVPLGLRLNWKIKVLTATGWSPFAGPSNFTTQ